MRENPNTEYVSPSRGRSCVRTSPGSCVTTMATSLRPVSRLPGRVAVTSAATTVLPVLSGSALSASADQTFRDRAPLRTETRKWPASGPISRILGTIQLWRQCLQSRRDLHEISDHLLKDIGLQRDDLEYGFARERRYVD
jgi:uncharacterized protein YjiS (DUF1127 family)